MPPVKLLRIISAGIVTVYQIGSVTEKFITGTHPTRFILGILSAIITGLVVYAILRIAQIAEIWYQDRLQSRRHHRDG